MPESPGQDEILEILAKANEQYERYIEVARIVDVEALTVRVSDPESSPIFQAPPSHEPVPVGFELAPQPAGLTMNP